MCAIGADGGYGDGCSEFGGASSQKTADKKRKWKVGQATEDFVWVLHDVTKIIVLQESGAYEDSSVDERTMLTFICTSRQVASGFVNRHRKQG